jgi:hypothetical protein
VIVIRFFIRWIFRAVGILFIAAAWLGYFGIWEGIGGFSFDFIDGNMGAAIGLTIAGIFLFVFSSAIARLGD